MSIEQDLAKIALQEKQLQFEKFNSEVAEPHRTISSGFAASATWFCAFTAARMPSV